MNPSQDQPVPTPPPVSRAFPIVAVGASAGGLAPTTELVHALGDRPEIALVVIHHLDPTRESGLVEILSRATTLPVVAASDDAPVEPNHVYVVPPNAGLLIAGGILKIVPRTEDRGLHLPINRFFESLALDRDGLAAGVVLSGTGFDGTEGIKAIKREGGITLAQDATAAHDGMPKSAIATGCVDFILPPAAIARELVRLGAQGPSLRAASPPGSIDRDYAEVLAAMRASSGINFSSYRQTTIQRRIERRLLLHGLTELPAYVELLKHDPAEVAALCEEALIHVTGFFRDPEAFDALRTRVFPKLCEGRAPGDPIRVWVPGCSTGEEVYSIAMSLLEFMEEAHSEFPVIIFGTDLSPAVIDRARAGRYPPSIESEISPVRLQRFFSRTESGYQIRRDVRDLCVFARHDISRDPPFSSMDLVSCRNLMIYLGPELQERVVALLHYCLVEPGFLLLGSAETVRGFSGFTPVDGKNKIYARTSAAPRVAFDVTVPRLPEHALPISGGPARSVGTAEVQREADRVVLGAFAPPGVVVTSDLAIVEFRGQTGRFLEHAPGSASLDLFRSVREELRLPLRRAVDRARLTQTPAREKGELAAAGDQRLPVSIEVIPFSVHAARQRYMLVLFDASAPLESRPAVPVPGQAGAETAGTEGALRQELASTRQYLESVIEQLEGANEGLRAANEEIVSSNEELRSTNEELQSAKEELQATNEELRTVNEEMRDRSQEAKRLSDDLTNVLTSIEIPILMIGRDSRMRRFTPAAARLFGLQGNDVGRPIADVPHLIALAPELPRLVESVVEHLRQQISPIEDGAGHVHELSVRPYVTVDGRIEGVVVSARDVDAEHKVVEYQERLQRMAFDATLTEERERRRIAIELHDRMGQALALAEIKLSSVRDQLTGEARVAIDGAVELLEQAIADKRTLVFELSPPLLYDLGLKEALHWLAEDLEKRHGIKIEIADDGEAKPMSDAAKAIVFRAVRELVMNVLKHANAPTAKVSLRRAGDQLEIDVEDRGSGFDLDAPASRGGFGLLSVREQITRLGGAVKVDSVRGLGTIASVRIPVDGEAEPKDGAEPASSQQPGP